MRSLCWARIDDRLIHGQVTVAWRQYLHLDEIWVVDDGVAADPFLQDALRLATPAGVVLGVYTIQEAASAWQERCTPAPEATSEASAVPGTRRVLVLVKSPQAALALVEQGAALSHLNVGNLAARPGSERAFKSISLTREHVAALDELAGRGVRITFQPVPDDAGVDWQAVRRRIRGR
jgi:mannose/fructose/N-acetylgalactosamine-specific phosphotransferase system component IIB